MPGSINGKEAAYKSGCCPDCMGCCWPIDCSVDLYPCGVLKDVSWEIEAPGCPELDGKSGIFTPVDPTAKARRGPCGRCACYINIAGAVLISGQRRTNVPNPFEPCPFTPCSLSVCFLLSCDPHEGTVTQDIERCCEKLRLIAMFPWSGASVTDAGNLLPVGTDSCEQNFGAECDDGIRIELAPSACVCGENNIGFTASFDLSTLVFACTKFFESGPCAGQEDCCRLFNCDLSEAYLHVG